jgi:hypothetical protein
VNGLTRSACPSLATVSTRAPAFVEDRGAAYLAIGFEWYPGSGAWCTGMTESGDSPALKGNVGIGLAVRMFVVNDVVNLDLR